MLDSLIEIIRLALLPRTKVSSRSNGCLLIVIPAIVIVPLLLWACWDYIPGWIAALRAPVE